MSCLDTPIFEYINPEVGVSVFCCDEYKLRYKSSLSSTHINVPKNAPFLLIPALNHAACELNVLSLSI